MYAVRPTAAFAAADSLIATLSSFFGGSACINNQYNVQRPSQMGVAFTLVLPNFDLEAILPLSLQEPAVEGL